MKNYNLGTYVLGLAALAVSVYVASMAWKSGQKSEDEIV
jgi:hypothetical protein|tara:strand:- start:3329 stop:3445 length:117 start_codon:yes stop_codon:yes gene_type:complete